MRSRIQVCSVLCAAAFLGSVARMIGAEPAVPVELITIFAWTDASGAEHIGDLTAFQHMMGTARLADARPLFRAATVEDWRPDLVPLFVVEINGRKELRRRPLAGTENFSNPLCFVLPMPEEITAKKLAGTWRCTATRPAASDSWFALQLTADGTNVVGRFDPHSEYRVADFAGGVVRSSHIELAVEYSGQRYVLRGELQKDRMEGSWVRGDGEEQGRWRAIREPAGSHSPPAETPGPLRSWKSATNDVRRYSIDAKSPGPAWSAVDISLGLVWPVTNVNVLK